MGFTTYIIFSKSKKKYYTGSTKHLENRLKEHNSGENISTKYGIPWELVSSFNFNTHTEALLLENKIKKRGMKRFLQDKQQSG